VIRNMGALAGIALGTLVLLGIVGETPGREGAQPATVAAKAVEPPAQQAKTVVNDLLTQTPRNGEQERFQVAANTSLNTKQLSCVGLNIGYVSDPEFGGDAPLTVSFVNDTRDNTGQLADVRFIEWYFTDPLGQNDACPTADVFQNITSPLSFQPVTFTFDNPGTYQIGMRVRLANGVTCPPLPGSGTPCTSLPAIVGIINVATEGEEIPPASLDFFDLLNTVDGQGAMPLNDWIPLFGFNMSYSTFAPRVLTYLGFELITDPILGQRPYAAFMTTNRPQEKHILEFGLFLENGGGEGDQVFTPIPQVTVGPDGEPRFTFPSNGDELLLRWDGHGWPYEMPQPNGQFSFNDARYDLTFAFDPTDPSFVPPSSFNAPIIFDTNNPRLPPEERVLAGPDPGRSYIVAVRLSSAWPSGQTLSYKINGFQMNPITANPAAPGGVIIDQPPLSNGEFVDTYPADFIGGETIQVEAGISASFEVFDITGGMQTGNNAGSMPNAWNWPNFLYTPQAEHARPRWDLGETILDFVGGEWLDIRQLASIEAWTPVLGINAHGPSREQLIEVNLILTDEGADPFGPPGNGGFDPRTALNPITTDFIGDFQFAIGNDYAFNGAWVYFDQGPNSNDTNCDGNGIFDPPTPAAGGGITFTDFPMRPARGLPSNLVDQLLEWEYIPFPPGGGDPWWKLKMRFQGGHRAAPVPNIPCKGFLEPIPDTGGALGGSFPAADFFVVLRADSGFRDVSGETGDGIGMALGTETRAFIEPRRWNPRNGSYEGGILFSNQLPYTDLEGIEEFWQDYGRTDETSLTRDCTEPNCPQRFADPMPFWHQRSNTIDNSKPIRFGIEVHDLTLTYSTSNRYGKQTNIFVGDRGVDFPGPDIYYGGRGFVITRLDQPLFPALTARTIFSRWADPGVIPNPLDPAAEGFGINQIQFLDRPDNLALTLLGFGTFDFVMPGIRPDASQNVPGSDDTLTASQYAFETVPFKLSGDAIDAQLRDPRSPFYPNPAQQPTLPRYETWPAAEDAVAFGFSSYAYLADDGGNNEPFFNPITNNSERSYEDDVYVYGIEDPITFATNELEGFWLVDNRGKRFRILSNTSNELTLQHGHAAWISSRFRDGRADRPVVPDYPFGVPLGIANATERGSWIIVRDTMRRGTYTRMSDWPAGLDVDGVANPGRRAARLLKQKITQNSKPTAVLGINLAGVDDPVVNASSPIRLSAINVAFWGPDFSPTDLANLDRDGRLVSSGVLLYEDSTNNGVFNAPIFFNESTTPVAFNDRIVPLQINSLAWQAGGPEPIDLTGNNQPDDLSGDGLVVLSPSDPAAQDPNWDGHLDLAWVVTLRPQEPWVLPHADNRIGVPLATAPGAKMIGKGPNWPNYWQKGPSLLDFAPLLGQNPLEDDGLMKMDKVLPAGGSPGNDLFVVIRTSDTIGAFEQFRTFIPARMPNRNPVSQQIGGIQMLPSAYPVVNSFVKMNPDEGAVEDFYGHDMMQVSVPARVVDLTSELPQVVGNAVIQPGSEAVAILGIDVSANKPEHLKARGTGGTSGGANSRTFTTTGIEAGANPAYFASGSWTQETVGLWLIAKSNESNINDARLEGYEITAVSGAQLTLRAGTPRNGSPWYVVKDPTFLEQVIVEFYDTNNDGSFDLFRDFLPLDHEDPINDRFSGVSIYRDNDQHPLNRNGVFDPPIRDANGNIVEYIDLPVRLDDPPVMIGTTGGEPQNQVKFVFSSPGTDNLVGRGGAFGGNNTVAYEDQPRRRQWIPQSFGRATSDEEFGPDFFVVVRTSRAMSAGDNFSAAIVSWGPDTPTEPDPDQFSPSIEPGDLRRQDPNEFKIFSEFPWGSRGLGFITFFKDPPPVHYWTRDKDTKKIVPTAEVDTSQDNRDVRYWKRSNPAVSGRTQVITALPAPTVDFRADRNRQAPGEPVVFTLEATGNIASVLWRFGDGTTSTQRNPTKIYNSPGVYTVSVTVTDEFGIEDTETKVDFIEITLAPFADFIGSPREGNIVPDPANVLPPGLDVSFVDLSLGNDEFVAISWNWNFGDGTIRTVTERPTAANPLVHRYRNEGFYTVTLQVTFQSTTGGPNVTRICVLTNYITVRPCIGCPGTGEGEGEGEGEGDSPPTADFNAESLVRDKHALLPLNNWVPLVNFTMGFDPEDPAPRVLQSMTLRIVPDGRSPEDLLYANRGAPNTTDLLEFGIFRETWSDDEDKNKVLDLANDDLIFSFDSNGAPIGTVQSLGPVNGLQYNLNFIGNGSANNPQFPITAGPNFDESIDGTSYIIAVRTSATWRSQLTLRPQILNARMVIPTTGVFPIDDEGEPVDSYSPNFFDGETLDEEASYSASFGVFDITGDPDGSGIPGYENAWNHPRFLYTPIAEYSRPSWSNPSRLLDILAGEMIEIRRLISVEDWDAVLGINLHGTKPLHFDNFSQAIERSYSGKDAPLLREVNIVMTDVGADPFGPPGNGGFDPRSHLDPMTSEIWGAPINPALALFRDITYNGVWVWHDTNGNGVFDPPTVLPDGGVTFNGDLPLLPGGRYTDLTSFSDWQYVPLPPGGGDPWWKIKLRFFNGTRRSVAEIADRDNTEGHLVAEPNNVTPAFSGSEVSYDYFVVVRTDSGFQDVSLKPGDGSGITMGAEFKTFIEPRRFNPLTGREDGGIYVDSMIPPHGTLIGNFATTTWQESPLWGETEPWWPERTHRQDSVQANRVGFEVHDLVLTYKSDSQYARQTDLFFGAGPFWNGGCYGWALPTGGRTDFDAWRDPFGLQQSRFLNMHSVGVIRWRYFGTEFFAAGAPTEDGSGIISVAFDETNTTGQFAFETVPFSAGILDGRSAAYPSPPQQPTLPEYDNWSGEVGPNEYPRLSQWAPEDAQARLLTQKTDINSEHVAMLGINTVGSADPIVNASNRATLGAITVAFWGPDFKPEMLMPLDPNGRSIDSGVLLWEDRDGNGTFFYTEAFERFLDSPTPLIPLDAPVPLRNLQWSSAPEFVDLTGDGAPDDLNGDGVVDSADKAWVLTMTPEVLWTLPDSDRSTQSFTFVFTECGSFDFSKGRALATDPNTELGETTGGLPGAKALDPSVAQPGDDLFITVRTSDKAKRFTKFRAVIPATLPERRIDERKAGIQFFPQVNSAPSSFVKRSPEEDPEQDFFGHDMLEINVPVKIVDLTNQSQDIIIGGATVPVLGLDIATNRPEGTVATGTSGSAAEGRFTVTGRNWTVNEFAGDWLVDERFESYEILSNTNDTLTLLSGTPRTGRWRIAREPTFLEQVIVELYNEGSDRNFNPIVDLLPLDIDQELSGIALYRDNTNHPNNRNGIFDPGIDIPITLDAPPVFIGQVGESIQAKFVFSSPGTDDFGTARRDDNGNIAVGGVARADQPRNRQWIPDTFGTNISHPDFGPDFFIVVRASERMRQGDNFRMGIVGWGPNTPTEPDPDTWANLETQARNDFTLFQEFPWGSRALGFITYFKGDNVNYFLEGNRAIQRVDNSGFDWVRTHTTKKRRSGVVTGQNRVVGPRSVVISSASATVLPSQTLAGQPFQLVIQGSGFGTRPDVLLSGYNVQFVSSTDTAITIRISTEPGQPPSEPIVIIVRNPDTNESHSRSDLFRLGQVSQTIPEIVSVTPNRGGQSIFPVIIRGKNLGELGATTVRFGQTQVPIQAISDDGTRITVGFPLNGFPATGAMDVSVNVANGGTTGDAKGVLVGGFTYVSDPVLPSTKNGFLGCGAGTSTGPGLSDLLVLTIMLTGLAFFSRRMARVGRNR